jgi:hypothetical protein
MAVPVSFIPVSSPSFVRIWRSFPFLDSDWLWRPLSKTQQTRTFSSALAAACCSQHKHSAQNTALNGTRETQEKRRNPSESFVFSCFDHRVKEQLLGKNLLGLSSFSFACRLFEWFIINLDMFTASPT